MQEVTSARELDQIVWSLIKESLNPLSNTEHSLT